MDLDETEKLFPGVRDKISAPKKQSAYAKERQAAEAKKRENKAANAALLRDFEASFDANDEEDDLAHIAARGRGPPSGPRGGYQERHNARSGPGSLGPAPGFVQPPSLKRKRALEEMREHEALRREEMLNTRRESTPQDAKMTDQEPEDSFVPKPTMHVSSLPPGVTAEQLKAVISPLLNVHSIRLSLDNARSSQKKSMSAIATLAPDTTIKQIDDAVSQLSDRYIGCGFTMIASRLRIDSGLHPSLNGAGGEQPFGAQRPQQRGNLRNAPPPEDGRFAPPDSYERRGPAHRELEIDMDKSLDLQTMRAIHTIADRLLSEEDPSHALELEALLMSLPEIQMDERFSFLFDSKSLGGLYYRYCLWKPDDQQPRDVEQLFQDHRTQWRPPSKRTPYSGLTHLSYAVQDADYISSDEESDDERQIPPHEQAQLDAQDKPSITPLQKARLAHLLARLPTANSRLRRGDVARVTNFAISHAANGIEEIVDMLLLNVDMPFSLSEVGKYEDLDRTSERPNIEDDEEYDPEAPLPTVEDKAPAVETKPEDSRDSDPSNAKLVALYVISDILNAIATAEGAKNAWKFRQLFEQGFRNQETFKRLGALDREYGWGKMKAEQWKRKIAGLLDMWEKSSAFGTDVIQVLSMAFNGEIQQSEDANPDEHGKDEVASRMPKWMTTIKRDDGDANANNQRGPALLDPESITSVSKKDEPDSKATNNDEPTGTMNETVTTKEPEAPVDMSSARTQMPEANTKDQKKSEAPQSASAGPKRRMRAEDMFAESDED